MSIIRHVSAIREFWQRLEVGEDAEEFVHPDDVEVLRTNKHSFNLKFPPNAFIGDVDRAPVVILLANGGYSSDTPKEFSTREDRTECLQCLWGKRNALPTKLSTYYRSRNYFKFVEQGDAAVVNAVAYRSPRISEEPENRRLAKILPSTQIHMAWLMNELLPAARREQRLVIAHRFGLWKSPHTERFSDLHYSTNPRSRDLSKQELARIERFLSKR